MARTRVRLDHQGIAAALKSAPVRAALLEVATEVANSVDAELPADVEAGTVVVDTYTTDRAAASVTIRDVRGRIYEARDGILSRAATAAGLEVSQRAEVLTYTTRSGRTRTATAAQIANWSRGSR